VYAVAFLSAVWPVKALAGMAESAGEELPAG
jgi:hypothetical protein